MALILAYRSHKGQNVAFQGSVAPMLNWYHSGNVVEQGGSGRPVLVLVAPFPEGLESPAEPEKPIIRAYRVI